MSVSLVARRQIRELQRLLGKKTMENEILKEAVEIAQERKWIARWWRYLQPIVLP